jgi:hypothetical protein
MNVTLGEIQPDERELVRAHQNGGVSLYRWSGIPLLTGMSFFLSDRDRRKEMDFKSVITPTRLNPQGREPCIQ